MPVIRIIGLATGVPSPYDGQYVKTYDPEAVGGRGAVTTTYDKNKALQFANGADAMAFWRQQSKKYPIRPDGKPNRPLTAFTVEIV